MSKFRVKFFKECRTMDTMTVVVEAENEEAARRKVEQHYTGTGPDDGDALSYQEQLTESIEDESVIESSWDGLMDASEPNAIVCLDTEDA